MTTNVDNLLAQWEENKTDYQIGLKLMTIVKSADFDTVLKIWLAACEIVNDPQRRLAAEADNDEAIDAIIVANRLRVQILQDRKEIKHRLPRDDNYRLPPGL